MTARANSVNVVIEVYNEFEGVRTLSFTFVPVPVVDDALVGALFAKNDALLIAAAKAERSNDASPV